MMNDFTTTTRPKSPPGGVTLACALFFFASALACVVGGSAAFAEEPNPYMKPNNTWISIGGEVKGVGPNTFVLDYGDGMVTVEMDDGDRDADAYKLIAGDKVIVHGKIDDDLFETTTIEASSVVVEKLGTAFYASAADEEDFHYDGLTIPVVVSSTIVRGTVTDVDAKQFTIDTGVRKLRVDVGSMAYDPLDDEGYQKIRVGDFVQVSGSIDVDFFEQRQLVADTIIELSS
jgi:hypothetical protein